MMEKTQIRLAKKEDLTQLLTIYEAARSFMRKSGNLTQWQGGYPPKELLLSDIEKQQLFVIERANKIVGVFALIMGEDPTYSYIENGAWISKDEYATIHRIASDGTGSGILKAAVSFAWEKIPHLRIDTHKDNLVMQRAILNCGFVKCGIIYLSDGSPRIAYEKISATSGRLSCEPSCNF